ncbi:uncharacterized protein LOC144467875 [Augochlora pura]
MEQRFPDDASKLWAAYAWWSCVLVLKMNCLSWVTGRIRVNRQVIHSEEDRMWMKGPNIILCPTGGGHKDVDRIRSAHRHDLGAALLYLLITPIWLCTSPPYPIARTILPCFAIASILYTIAHMEIGSPHRYCKTILAAVELCILISMFATILVVWCADAPR